MQFKKIFGCALIFTFFVSLTFASAFKKESDSNKTSTVVEKNIKTIKQVNENLKKELNKIPAKSYILTDYNTGQVLYEKNADEPLAIASLTKIMTILLVVEAIEEKKISLNDMVTATKNAKPSLNESSIWLKVGEKMSVEDLLKAVIIISANDATRTLAEFIAKSEQSFVNLMNKRAKELKLKNTNFVNASGLDDPKQYSSARDIAILTKELLKHQWILKYTSMEKATIREKKFNLKNTNQLLKNYKGCNGLKTGTEKKAGNCLCATAFKKNMGLCAISLGSTTRQGRFKICEKLLDYGFNNFKVTKIKKSK